MVISTENQPVEKQLSFDQLEQLSKSKNNLAITQISESRILENSLFSFLLIDNESQVMQNASLSFPVLSFTVLNIVLNIVNMLIYDNN